jgi:hypothetical protein
MLADGGVSWVGWSRGGPAGRGAPRSQVILLTEWATSLVTVQQGGWAAAWP